jgi:1-deoxy-D-xylulose-5-phosphate synthase
VAITAAMPEGTGLKAFRERYPDRFFDVGIAEQHAVTFAAGLACAGMRPVVAVYSTFLQRAYDQVIHDVALQKLPVVFAIDRGGIVGEDGPTHHGAFDLSFLRAVPNLVLMAPQDEPELRRMLATGLARDDGPSALRYPRGAGPGHPLPDAALPLEIGRAEVLREGRDAWLLAVGSMVAPCREAAVRLEAAGLSVGVVNLRFIKPLDADLLQRILVPGVLAVTVEENTVVGGAGAAVLEWAAARGGDEMPDVMTLGLPDRFLEQASRDVILHGVGLDAAAIADRVRLRCRAGRARAAT